MVLNSRLRLNRDIEEKGKRNEELEQKDLTG